MSTATSYQSQGLRAVTPGLAFENTHQAIEFYKYAFGATEMMVMSDPGGSGKVMHAELAIGDAAIMLADEFPQYNSTPKRLGGVAVNLMVYVPDVDDAVQRAVSRGAKLLMPVTNQFYGDRSGRIEDPFGYVWIVSTHVEDVPPEEMEQRMKAWSDKNCDDKKD